MVQENGGKIKFSQQTQNNAIGQLQTLDGKLTEKVGICWNPQGGVFSARQVCLHRFDHTTRLGIKRLIRWQRLGLVRI